MVRATSPKRGQGRPADGVGKDAVLATAQRLIRELPPARVTISLVAREAGVDPALVRYYFGDRTKLLLAVAESMLRETPRPEPGSLGPIETVEHSIRQTARFTNSTKHIHRLMVDELADAKATSVGEHLGALNRQAVKNLESVMARDGGETLRQVDPAMLHIALLGLFDFFASAEPVVRQLVPEGTDSQTLLDDYTAFVNDLILNGLRKRD